MEKPTILLIGTCDTKLPELLYTISQCPDSTNILLMDVGRTPTLHPLISIQHPDLTTTTTTKENKENEETKNNGEVIRKEEEYKSLPRTTYIQKISNHATTTTADLYKAGRIHAILSLGGSCGTNIATAAMRQGVPVGFPKLMVSTMASGDVSSYIEETDITLMYSVVDVAGGNWILKRVLGNALFGAVGMALREFTFQKDRIGRDVEGSVGKNGGDGGDGGKKRVGVTMFGVTTPCVDVIRERLEREYGAEVYVFHATGAGGKAMERLVREGQIDAVVDLTTSEVVDELMGGVLSAGPARLEAAAKKGIPQVVSVGACEMANFGPPSTIPPRYEGRVLYEHNPTVTLVRANAEESRQIARFIAEKLRTFAVRPDLIRLVLPTGGISMVDVPGQSFYDPEVDEVLFSTIEKELQGSGISITRDPRHINDPDFATSVADMLGGMITSM
ncbi:hypothetical protein BDV25DRAFT_33665 [Aspergillus avenaceus]|uniref:Uncharacterized protein n=1 Tax=Aspergillus avenaceus TaxID=36643 RepID=A0A5N6TM24_ASPAV|nr:hypothetical protein BDV25DRAFT_33665 [Aspergillus avenaceus]